MYFIFIYLYYTVKFHSVEIDTGTGQRDIEKIVINQFELEMA